MPTRGTDFMGHFGKETLKIQSKKRWGIDTFAPKSYHLDSMCFSLHVHVVFWLLTSSPGFEINAGIMSRPPLGPGTDIIAAGTPELSLMPSLRWQQSLSITSFPLLPGQWKSLLGVCHCPQHISPLSGCRGYGMAVTNCLSQAPVIACPCSAQGTRCSSHIQVRWFDGFCLVACASFGSPSFQNDLTDL